MLTLPPSVRIYVAVEPTDARKSFDSLVALVESDFRLEPRSGHLFLFLNRRGHLAQLLFWDRNGFWLMKKRLEAGTFRLAQQARDDARHVEIDSAELALMLEGIELAGAKRRKRYVQPRAEN
jgi:transposase